MKPTSGEAVYEAKDVGDAPDGFVWQCAEPRCDVAASLSENVRYHLVKKGHERVFLRKADRYEVSPCMFRVGDRVEKPKGYPFPGVVRGVFRNEGAGAWCVAVELEIHRGKPWGMIHIFAPSQLALVERAT